MRRPFYHAEIAKAWELLLLNQAHDGIGGCSIDAVHRENAHRYEQAHQLLDAVAIRDARALDRIALQGVPADCWLIVNTGDRPYTGPVRVSAEERLRRQVFLTAKSSQTPCETLTAATSATSRRRIALCAGRLEPFGLRISLPFRPRFSRKRLRESPG